MANAYLDRKSGLIGTAGRKSEKGFAKKHGARLTPNSGATAGAKGDMKLGDFLLEHKSTATNTMSIRLEWLLKISHEALHTGKKPALSFAFTNQIGASKREGEWVVLPASVWKELIE